MVVRKGTKSTKATKKVKSLATRAVSSRQAKDVRGGSASQTKKRMPTAVE